MKTIKYIALTLVGVFFLAVSCKDDKELVPVWESGVTAFAKVAAGSESDFVFGYPALGVTYDYQWISADAKSTVTKVEFSVLFNEAYKDSDGNDALAEHGGEYGLLWKTLEGGNVPANRVNTSVTVTQADVYALYSTAKYDYGSGEVDVFGGTPENPDRDVTNRFVPGDAITVIWKLTLADGRVIGGQSGGTGWSPSTCSELPGSNCQLAWGVDDPADFAPKATMTLKSGKNLKAASKDTVFIAMSKEVTPAPTLALAAVDGPAPSTEGTIGAAVLYKTSKTQYYAIYTAPADYTGGIKVTASGSATTGTAPFGGLVMPAKSITVNVDNTAPEGVGNSRFWIGVNQIGIIKMTFNEPMSTAAKDSIYVESVTGGNMDLFEDKRMTISADGLSATIPYAYKDADDDAIAEDLVITVAGGKDVAGNALSILTQPAGTIDLFTPGAPTVTLAGPYDFGTQLKIASAAIVNPGGSTKGTIYWVAVIDGAAAPVHPYDTDDAEASGSFSPSTGAQFIDFAPNGDFDLYFYTVTDTNNQGDFTVTALDVTMDPNN